MLRHSFSSLISMLTLLLGCAFVSFGCEGRVGQASSEMSVLSNAQTESQHTEELPLETTLSSDERAQYVQVLSGIYEELVRLSFDINSPIVEEYGANDPSRDCDRCGRETGFLPAPDLYLNRFIPVELKGLTFGLVSWVIDELEVQESLEELLSERAPTVPLISFRLSVVRVDIDSMSPETRTLASAGELIENRSSDDVSITSVTTGAMELGLTFEQGFAYVLFITLIEGETKLTSLPSAPVMVYCHSEVDETMGCTHLMAE